MNCLQVSALIIVAGLSFPAAAQEHVVVGTQRSADNGALFLAAAEGYFKAEGIDLGMTAFDSDQMVAETLASGVTDFGLAAFTPAAFNFAGKGEIKAIAAQVREKRAYEGAELVASNVGYAKGMRKFEDIANRTIAIDTPGFAARYQLEQIARIKKVDFSHITIKPMRSFDAIARAVGTNEVDGAILPAAYARELLGGNQGKLVGWYSELDEQQLGALFVSSKMIATRREVVEKFMRAYRHGAADYAEALLRKDRNSKRTSDIKSHEAATKIARYVYPSRDESGASAVEGSVYYIEPQAKLDMADIERQIAWYKAQGLIDKSIAVRNVIDPSFAK